ncbi:MAG: NAD(P)H-binding protein [Bacteroidota bacterium]
MKTALLIGATGFIGSHLLTELLNNNNYSEVTIIVRKNSSLTHPKLKILIGDFKTFAAMIENSPFDEIFLTLGTTKKNTPKQDEYYEIDHDYPVLAAQIAKQSGARSVFIVTAIGANVNSKLFYPRMKGEVARDIIAIDFQHTHIFEPSMITGKRPESRIIEKIFIPLFKLFNPLLAGSLTKYRGIDGKNIAKAMHNAAQQPSEKLKIYRWKEMMELL